MNKGKNKDKSKKEALWQNKQAWLFLFWVISSFLILFTDFPLNLLHLLKSSLIKFIGFCFVSIVFIGCALWLNPDNKKDRFNQINLVILILQTLLFLSQAMIFYEQKNIMNHQADINLQQAEILDRTSQPNVPSIVLLPSQGKTAFSLDSLLDKEPSFNIGLINMGKMPAPYVVLEFLPQREINGVNGLVSSDTFKDLNPLTYNITKVRFSLYNFNKTLFKFGEKNITFVIRCSFCKVQEDYQNITICVYNISKEECGSGWKTACC